MFSNPLSAAAFSLDDPIMYVLYAIVLAFVIALSLYYLIISLKKAKKLGMDMVKIKKVITTSISFSILPAIGIALGVVTLVGSLGVAFPAIRLSVIGSLQYETQMAAGAASAITGDRLDGLGALMRQGITANDLVTMATVMSIAIMTGPIVVLVFYRRLQPKLGSLMGKTTNNLGGGSQINLGELVFQVCFIGMVLGYLAMSISSITSNVAFIDSYYNFIAVVVAMIIMYVCDLLITKAKWTWLDSFATPLSMIIAMIVVAIISYCASKYGWALSSDAVAAVSGLV